jgi:hypothetical protein
MEARKAADSGGDGRRVATMTRLHDSIQYRFSETDCLPIKSGKWRRSEESSRSSRSNSLACLRVSLLSLDVRTVGKSGKAGQQELPSSVTFPSFSMKIAARTANSIRDLFQQQSRPGVSGASHAPTKLTSTRCHGTCCSQSLDVPHRRQAEEAAVFPTELAHTFVANFVRHA